MEPLRDLGEDPADTGGSRGEQEGPPLTRFLYLPHRGAPSGQISFHQFSLNGNGGGNRREFGFPKLFLQRQFFVSHFLHGSGVGTGRAKARVSQDSDTQPAPGMPSPLQGTAWVTLTGKLLPAVGHRGEAVPYT